MEKVLAELRVLQAYREKHVGEAAAMLALGLSSRKNMCVHPRVAEEGSRESVDARCRQLTASWVREKHEQRARERGGADDGSCASSSRTTRGRDRTRCFPRGCTPCADLRQFGRTKGWCPYFTARHMIKCSNVVVYNYQYLLDPKVASLVSGSSRRSASWCSTRRTTSTTCASRRCR